MIVGTTRAPIAGVNLNRRYLLFVNTHTANVTVYFGGDLTGITIPPSLGSWEIPTTTFQAISGTHKFFSSVDAIAASGSGDLQIVEG